MGLFDSEEEKEEKKKSELGETAKGAAKTGLKAIGNAVWNALKPFLIKLIIILVAISLLASCLFAVQYIIEETLGKIGQQILDFFKIGDRTNIEVTDDDVDELIKIINKMGYELEDLNMKSNSEDTKKYLKAFLQAELATYYPKLSNSGMQGIVRIMRSDGETQPYELEYMKKEDFDKLIQKVNESNGSNTSDRERLKKVFTMDDQRKVYVSTWNSVTEDGVETYTVSSKTINYTQVVEKYAMPMEVPIALTVMTQNPEYVYNFLMKEVMGLDPKTGQQLEGDEKREIIITIQDTLTTYTHRNHYIWDVESQTTTRTRPHVYTRPSINAPWKLHMTYSEDVKGPVIETAATDQTGLYKEIITKTLKSTPQITRANTWMMYQTVEYTATPKTTVDEQTNTVSEENYPEGLPSPVRQSEEHHTAAQPPNESSKWTSATVNEVNVHIDYYLKNLRRYDYDQVDTTVWSEGILTIDKEKIDQKAKEIIAQWDVEYEVPDMPGANNAFSVGPILEDGPEWFFELLSGSRTQKQREIFKYLLYLYTGEDYGVTELDYSIFQDLDLTIMTNDIIVDTTKSEAKYVVTDLETLQKMIKKCFKGDIRKNLLAEAQVFLDIQKEYNVNAVFAIAVAVQESSAGTNWALIDESTYNMYSIQGEYKGQSYTDSNGTSWRKYGSFETAIWDFGDLIANTGPYFRDGNDSVSSIGNKYCVPPENWIKGVLSIMKNMYSVVGISVGAGNGQLSGENGDGYWSTYTRGDNVYKLYYQNWPSSSNEWGYGNEAGLCHAAAVATVLSGYGRDMTPADTASVAGGVGGNYGNLGERRMSVNRSQIVSYIQDGIPIMVYIGPNRELLSSSYHFVVLLDVDETGENVFVANPWYIPDGNGGQRGGGWMSLDFVLSILNGSEPIRYILP